MSVTAPKIVDMTQESCPLGIEINADLICATQTGTTLLNSYYNYA